MSIFDNFRPRMTDATVSDPDYSEAELETIEPTENATKDEKDMVEFEDASGTEAISLLKLNRSRVRTVQEDLRKRINKIARLHKALQEDSSLSGRLSSTMKVILMEEEIIGDSAADDAKDAAGESSPSDIADKGASEEELAKASLRAQYRAYRNVYNQLKKI